jgi:threonine dehydratase
VLVSPCPESIPLSELCNCTVYCKLEYLQRTGSFKERGARNALLSLSAGQRTRGVIAASAGNHALGLAYHGKLLGVPVTVVMPRFSPLIKVGTCRRLNANVILHGETFDQARRHALELADEQGFTYVHGYNDPAIIAGQGTLGLEILDQVPDADAVVVPIGGGGLIAGISCAVKSVRPRTCVIGVEARSAACFSAAVQAGSPADVACGPTLADGLAVGRVGEVALATALPCVDRVVQVSEESLALAVLRLLELEKAVVEGAGAAALAAFIDGCLPELIGRKVVLLLSGGNIDSAILDRIIEKGLAADGRLYRFTAVISDRPGGLARFAQLVADTGASIKEVEHDRAFAGPDVAAVRLTATVETYDRDHIGQLRRHLTEAGIPIQDR